MSWQHVFSPLRRATRSRRNPGEAAARRRTRARRPVLDGLEDRHLLTLSYDFGTATSALMDNYTRVTAADRFDAQRGFGWTSGRVTGLDRNLRALDALRTDWVGSSDGNAIGFAVNLSNGTYDVTVTAGDYFRSLNTLGVTLEGSLAGTITTAAQQFAERTYRVTVSDGRLDMTLDGPDRYALSFFINGLRIDPVADQAPVSNNFDFGTATSALMPGYTRATADRFDAVLGYGWTSGRPMAVDRNLRALDALRTDWVGSSDGNAIGFAVNLSNGTYDVTVTAGDYFRSLNTLGVTLEGSLAGTITTAAQQFAERTYRVTVSDGRLDMTLDAAQRYAYNIFISGLTIRPVADANYHDVYVGTDQELRNALAYNNTPGTRILVRPGVYSAVYAERITGTADQHIVIAAADPNNKPIFRGGGNSLFLRTPAYLELRDLILDAPSAYAVSIDDAGDYANPAHDIIISGLEIRNPGSMGFKLSGMDNFLIQNCTVTNPGFMGIDMVGCHNGVVEDSTFVGNATMYSGILAKGGSKDVVIRDNLLQNCGARSVEIGGWTDPYLFRPSFQGYEAKDIIVEGNVIIGSNAPITYGSADGGTFRYNTIYRPTMFLLRILQDNSGQGVIPCRNGIITDNIIVYQRSEIYAAAPINIGGGTQPETFQFARNWWYAMDDPSRSRPTLPSAEIDGHVGIDPQFIDAVAGNFHLQQGSPAAAAGAYAPRA